MNIPQPEGGGNGESADVVNDWLLWRAVDLRGGRRLLRQIISRVRFSFPAGNSFDCAAGHVVLFAIGAQRIFAMIETVTAFLGLFSAGIFIAHAFEGFRSRA
jgi:hypothetical protein